LAKDVQPFLFDAAATKKVIHLPEYIKQVNLEWDRLSGRISYKCNNTSYPRRISALRLSFNNGKNISIF